MAPAGWKTQDAASELLLKEERVRRATFSTVDPKVKTTIIITVCK